MSAAEQIKAKQVEWAKNRGIKLIGSAGDRGEKLYTTSINQNLFQPLNKETRKELEGGDGNELHEDGEKPAKIQALHSSSALGVNIFDYWRDKNDLSLLFSACEISRSKKLSGTMGFEQKFSIDKRFQYAPNIDVVFFHAQPGQFKAFAIECKFTEAYGARAHGGMDSKYFDNNDIWKELPATKKLAKTIEGEDTHFKYLHAAQLIKHTLGLNKQLGHSNYRLLYLWYDALGEPGHTHHNEVSELSETLGSDGVFFHSITYQELIVNLAKYRDQHNEYITYITERYL